MKNLIFLSVLLSLPALSATDWKATYETMENKEETLSFEDYTEACQQGVEAACQDGWYNKVTRQIGLDNPGEPTLSETFLTKLQEVCDSPNMMMCDTGLNMLSVPLDNANKEQAPGMEKANEVYNKYTVSNCQNIVQAGGQSYFCQGILPKTDNKTVFVNFVTACLDSKDNAVCEKGLKGSEQLTVSGEYLDNICKDDAILNLPVCAQRLEWKNNAIKQREESDSFYGKVFAVLGLIAAGFIAMYVYSTRCPSCRKFFAVQTLSKDHIGTDFKGTETQNIKTGEVRDQNYNTVATIHRDVKFNVFNKKFKVSRRCKKCGYQFQYEQSETKKVRA